MFYIKKKSYKTKQFNVENFARNKTHKKKSLKNKLICSNICWCFCLFAQQKSWNIYVDLITNKIKCSKAIKLMLYFCQSNKATQNIFKVNKGITNLLIIFMVN